MTAPARPSPSAVHPATDWGLATPGLGLALGGTHGAGQLEAHARWVELAESLGLHSVWLPEMHFARGVCPAPLVELAGHAAATTRLRLGTTSLLLPLHPPEAIAAEIAGLDRLSRGRALVGLGRGFQRPMLEAFGVAPASKRDRFDEALDRILELWAEAWRGRAPAGFRPFQRPHPPLAVAAFGPKGLAQAARRGLPYLASPVETFEQIAENQARHREQIAENQARHREQIAENQARHRQQIAESQARHREPPGTRGAEGTEDGAAPSAARRPLSLVMRTVFVSEDEAVRTAVRDALGREMAGRRGGMPAAVDRALDAPLEARAVVGATDAVIERLVAERRRLGIDLLVVRPTVAGIPTEVQQASFVRLAETVWPAVRAATGGAG